MAGLARILIIVENLTVPLDRRVWQEARALSQAGHVVSIICPKGGAYTSAYEVLEGIHIFRHPQPFEADGALGYAIEYVWAIAWEFALSVKAWWRVGFDVVQACNPPDLLFLIAGFWKYVFGKRFVFDHHDINPELFEAKFGRRGLFHKLLLALERMTFNAADVTLATNKTFEEIAIARGGMAPDRVFIVRSVPDLTRFKRTAPVTALKNGRPHLVGYIGIMGAQDGVDLLIEAMDILVNRDGRGDVQCAIVGSGTELARLEAMVEQRSLGAFVSFKGFLSGHALLEALSTFDVGVIPDPKNAYNDKISMNKVFEYMALGIPFVSFDLAEGRRASGDAALYAQNNDPADLARRIAQILDDADLKGALGEEGRARARQLTWETERVSLLAAYDKVIAGTVMTADECGLPDAAIP